MTDKKIYLLKEVMSGETVAELSKRLKLSEEFIEKLQKVAKAFRITGGE